MEQQRFDQIGNSKDNLLKFFRENFEDVIDLVGEERLIEQYFNGQKLPLISIKVLTPVKFLTFIRANGSQCHPYHYRDRCVIIGDAAHAMVPFYGQGMNAGFEDVRVLFDHLAAHPNSLSDALAAYSANRMPDGHIINELAMQNHIEMRASVISNAYLVRKAVEEALYAYVPWLGVRTMYSMISFSNIRYSEVVAKVKRQRRWLNAAAGALVAGGLAGGLWGVNRLGLRRVGFGVGCLKGVVGWFR